MVESGKGVPGKGQQAFLTSKDMRIAVRFHTGWAVGSEAVQRSLNGFPTLFTLRVASPDILYMCSAEMLQNPP